MVQWDRTDSRIWWARVGQRISMDSPTYPTWYSGIPIFTSCVYFVTHFILIVLCCLLSFNLATLFEGLYCCSSWSLELATLYITATTLTCKFSASVLMLMWAKRWSNVKQGKVEFGFTQQNLITLAFRTTLLTKVLIHYYNTRTPLTLWLWVSGLWISILLPYA